MQAPFGSSADLTHSRVAAFNVSFGSWSYGGPERPWHCAETEARAYQAPIAAISGLTPTIQHTREIVGEQAERHLGGDLRQRLGQDSSTKRARTLRIAGPLSLRKSAIVLWSGTSRPSSHITSTLRPASRSSRRLDCTRSCDAAVHCRCGGAGEIENVSHTFQPSARCSASNSL